jgi:hypothetical protein
MRIATICVAAAALVAAAAIAATVAGPGSSAEAARCDTLTVPARIAGKVVCLSVGDTCRGRHRARYLRYGFRCRAGSLEYDWRPLRRPLRVPSLAAGTACPASPARPNGDGTRFPSISFGPGPAYPTLGGSSGRASIRLTWSPTDPPYLGWAGTKVLWGVPRYAGAVLIRGRQLDGPNEVGFDLGPQWTHRVHPEIRLVGPEYDLHPAATFVRAPGCYAYQVDTFRSSYLIVFQAHFVEK